MRLFWALFADSIIFLYLCGDKYSDFSAFILRVIRAQISLSFDSGKLPLNPETSLANSFRKA